jgi:tRNA(His) 5'-end guanylyltransferase
MSRMDLTAKYLCANIQGAKLAYVQSDEISILMTDFDAIQTQAWFDGNIQKIVSVSASMAAGFFNSISKGTFGSNPYDNVEKYQGMDVNDWIVVADKELAAFDARVFTIPDKVEVYNYFVWRIQDWESNSLQMLARSYYNQSDLHGKSWDELQSMIVASGGDWHKLDPELKYGRICSTRLGGMWGTYAAPDLHDPKQKEEFKKLIPEHGYEL